MTCLVRICGTFSQRPRSQRKKHSARRPRSCKVCDVRTWNCCTARVWYRYGISVVKQRGLFVTSVETEMEGRLSAFDSKGGRKTWWQSGTPQKAGGGGGKAPGLKGGTGCRRGGPSGGREPEITCIGTQRTEQEIQPKRATEPAQGGEGEALLSVS